MREWLRRILGSPARVKVEIMCPCGPFIPGAYTPGTTVRRYSCERCGFHVRLSSFRGEVDW